MKRFLSLLFVGLFLILCLIPSLGLLITGGSGAAANQVLAPKPVLLKSDGRLNTAWLEDLSRYVNDRFSLRQEAVTLWARLNAGLLHSSVTDQVILGKDGWLYFSATLPDYTRTAPMSERELWCAARRLWLLQEYAEAQGGQFLFTVAPNKNQLYPEGMPVLRVEDGPTNTEALYRRLDDMGVAYLDLHAVFRAAGPERLYFNTDSHWNSRGAALAADAILGALGRESAFFAGPFADAEHLGDLYEMLYPTGTEAETDPVYASGFSFEASSANPDSISISTRSETGEGTLLMYRDSFGRSLYPYLAEAYGEAFFSRKNDYDPTALQPGGALVIELVERNLRYLLDYTPTLPAAARDAALAEAAQDCGAQIELHLAKGGPEGYTVLRGEPSGFVPDDKSPIYIDTVLGLYEALPGAEGFSLCLPEEAAQGPVRVLFYEDGVLLSLTGISAS
ncbi:MAG: alginate O-acetyltransferase AlgX-related protein [Clostridia bacterium]